MTNVARPDENVFGHRKKLDLIVDALAQQRRRLGRGLRVLDVGCGNGRAVTRFLATPGDHVTGLDLHEPSIAYAREQFGSAALEFRVGTLEDLAADSVRYDVVVMSDVLEHVPDPRALLAAAAALLADDGRVLLSVPNGHGPFEIESAVARAPLIGRSLLWVMDRFVAVLNKTVLRGVWSRWAQSEPAVPYNIECGHVQFFSRPALRALFSEQQLRVLAFHRLSFLSGPFTNYLLAPSRTFCRLNTRVADHLPAALVSAWWFELERRPDEARMSRATVYSCRRWKGRVHEGRHT
jgi:SAM-dependent methyltransferase